MEDWIEDPERLSDSDCAEIVRRLAQAAVGPMHFSVAGRMDVFGEYAVDCHCAQRTLRPLPGSDHEYDNGLRQAVDGHVGQCPACQGWQAAGMPCILDPKAEGDRRWFCGRMRAFIRDSHRPLSRQAGEDHAQRCADCNAWLEARRASQECGSARAYIEETEGEKYRCAKAYWVPDPLRVLWDHLADCQPCLQWASSSVTCEAVREEMARTVRSNEGEWKKWRNSTLDYRHACHLHTCPACRQHLEANHPLDLDSEPLHQILEHLHHGERSKGAAVELQDTYRDAVSEILHAV